MDDGWAGSGLEAGWKRAGSGLADARASVCSCRPGVTELTMRPSEQPAFVRRCFPAACLADAATQSLLADDAPPPNTRELGWHCRPGTCAPSPVEAVKPGSHGRRWAQVGELSRVLSSRGVV